jgi:mitochondrial fission protein ELM1
VPEGRATEPVSRRIWVLAGEKPGDNAQSLSLAAAIGWPFEVKHLRYGRTRSSYVALAGGERFPLDRAASSALEPPWPDLVIGCGRRSVGVACEIRRQAGPATKLVQLGRPRADLDLFDLVVTTPQYRLPELPNVIHLALPLHRIDEHGRAAAAAEWQPKLAALPRPWFAVLVGGSAKPFVFDAAAGRKLGEHASALAREAGGALLVSTSRRTPEDAADAFLAAITVPAYVHRWTAAGGANPYVAYLALADGFVVTGDSASMLTEACSTGKRTWFAELPEYRPPRARVKIALRSAAASVAPALARHGWVRYPRDLKRLHAALVASNRALPLPRPFTTAPPPPLDETERAAARVRALFDRSATIAPHRGSEYS